MILLSNREAGWLGPAESLSTETSVWGRGLGPTQQEGLTLRRIQEWPPWSLVPTLLPPPQLQRIQFFSLAPSGPLRIEETSMYPTKGDQNCPSFKTESPACWRPLSPRWIGLLFPPSQLLWFITTQTVVWAPAPPVLLSLDMFWSLELPQALEGPALSWALQRERALALLTASHPLGPSWCHLLRMAFCPPKTLSCYSLTKLCPLSSWTHHNTCKIHLFSLFPQLQSCSMTVGITGLFFHPCHQHEARGWGPEASGQYLRGGGMNPDPPWATLSKSWLLRTSPPPHPNQAVVIPISPETSLHPSQTILPYPPP